MRERLFPFQQIQEEFNVAIRDPQQPGPNDIDPQGMQAYQTLVFNTINTTIANAFPVIHHLLDDSHWQRMVREFCRLHSAKTPFFYEIPEEFLAFLHDGGLTLQPYPFIAELAHYEWMELALDLAEDEAESPSCDLNADLMTTVPVFCDHVVLLQYHYPVHKICREFIPDKAGEYYYLIYRTALNKVEFIELNALSAQFLGMLLNQQYRCDEMIDAMYAQIYFGDKEEFSQHAKALLRDLHCKGVIIGGQ